MAESMAEAKKMLAAAKKNKKIYAVIQNRRYMDNIIASDNDKSRNFRVYQNRGKYEKLLFLGSE